MALDLFGPANADGAVTSRPGDTRAGAFGALDTFFKDCSSPTLDDGTEFQAAWFNQMLAILRGLARGNGLTAGSAAIVAEDNTDDNILLKSAQYLIQRGLMKYGVDTGAADVLVVSLSPALSEYKAGQSFLIRKAASINATTTPTININGLGARTIKSIDGSPIPIGALPASCLMHLFDDGTNLLILNLPSNAQTALYLHATSGGTTTLINNTVTLVADFSLVEGNISDATFSGGVLTIGAKSAGVWEFAANLGIATPFASWTNKVELIKNSGIAGTLLIAHTEFGQYGTALTGNAPAVGVAKLKAGDTVGAYCIQNTGSSQTASNLSRFVAKRVGV